MRDWTMILPLQCLLPGFFQGFDINVDQGFTRFFGDNLQPATVVDFADLRVRNAVQQGLEGVGFSDLLRKGSGCSIR